MSRANYKIPNYKKDYIKNELYHYWDNKIDFENLDKDVINESAPPPDGQPRGSGTGNPTQQKAEKIEELKSTKSILLLERKLKAIERVFKRLTKEEYEVVELIFKKGQSQIYTQMHNYINKDTYYNTYNKVIYLTAVEFGEI